MQSITQCARQISMKYFVQLLVSMAVYMSVPFCLLYMHKLYMYICICLLSIVGIGVLTCSIIALYSLYWIKGKTTEENQEDKASFVYIYQTKLQALVYDILPSTTAVFSYAIGSRKLSANEQSFVGAQTVVSLLQTTQIKQSVSFIAANKVYTSTNKTTIVWIGTELFSLFLLLLLLLYFYFTRGGCVSCLRALLLLQSY